MAWCLHSDNRPLPWASVDPCLCHHIMASLGHNELIWYLMKLWFPFHIDGLVRERRNSNANALELRLSCTHPSICARIQPVLSWNFASLFRPLCVPFLTTSLVQITRTTLKAIQPASGPSEVPPTSWHLTMKSRRRCGWRARWGSLTRH